MNLNFKNKKLKFFIFLYNSNQLNKTNKMERERNQFPDDHDKRIQKWYYDVNIHTIFNRTKLQNVKNKFWKYIAYLNKKYYNHVQPKLLELQKIRDELYVQCKRAKRISLIHNPTPENVEKREALVPIFRKADEEYEEMKYEEYYYDNVISTIYDKLNEIKTQQKKVRKHYKKCAHCEKMDMVTICGCKSNHKLCSECIYDKTECPVCDEDLGLVYCDICYEYKKELVDTGCENKHQTCKNCLDKIKHKNNLCPFCRGCCCSSDNIDGDSSRDILAPSYQRFNFEDEERRTPREGGSLRIRHLL